MMKRNQAKLKQTWIAEIGFIDKDIFPFKLEISNEVNVCRTVQKAFSNVLEGLTLKNFSLVSLLLYSMLLHTSDYVIAQRSQNWDIAP